MDPYKVLGIPPSAGDDEVKKAYRALVKKYHPDRYAQAPAEVQKQASEKAKQINAAYEAIQKERSGAGSSGGYGGYDGGYGGYGGYTSTGYAGSSYADIREMISRGLILQAEQVLLRRSDRSAEWHFLYGVVAMRRGWFAKARESFQTACGMDPSNAEYRQALDQIEGVYAQTRNRTRSFDGNWSSVLCTVAQCLACSGCCGGRICCC